ncbi:MAG: RagB/SusD family nutrient uptake outer membrane protein [Arachidicoccus sp.]|nr:RagB/SusD family nutrient uptake outer membrane protein [Arachidicoccus sp.]
MNTINKQIIMVAWGAILVFASCNKYLDKKPDKSLVEPSTMEDLQAILDNKTLMNNYSPSVDEACSDDYYLSATRYAGFLDFAQKAYTWQLDGNAMDQAYNNISYNEWSILYDQINKANIVLDNISNANGSSNPTIANSVHGQALFYRGYAFFQLVLLFSQSYDGSNAGSQQGIVLKLNSSTEYDHERSSLSASYSQIISDLSQSTALLDDLPEIVTRPSKCAAFALLARVYLSRQQYDSALYFAKESLTLDSSLLNYNNTSDVNIASNTKPFQQFNKEVIFQKISTQYIFPNTYPLYCNVDSVLYKSYEADDLRLKAFFWTNGDGYSFKGSYSGTRNNLFKGIATDELYLDCAECFIRRGQMTEGLSYLNTLLINRYTTGKYQVPAFSSQQEALQFVLQERRKELLFRSVRWMDLKRLNREGAGIIQTRVIDGRLYTLPSNANQYAIPIPSYIITQTGISQN